LAAQRRNLSGTAVMPKQPFWFFLTWSSILWYGFLVGYVGWKGFEDIQRMIRHLKSGRQG
jgi:hypothetical protein